MIHHPDFKFREDLLTRKETKYIVVHHVGVRGSFSAEDIHQMHLNRKCNPPMAGIAYHYYIRKNGEIYEGRPRWKKGAHVNDKVHHYNSVSVGICFEGDFNHDKMEDMQLEASILLLSVLSLAYGNAEICTHRYLDSRRDCPGKNFPFQELLNKVHAQKQRFIKLYGDPKEADYIFLLKSLG